LLEDKTKVHVTGVPLLSVADCRLRRSFRLRRGCMESKGTTCAFPFGLASCELVSGMSNPRLRLVWKRGPLAPVVGEGQVNLVATGCSRMRAMVKVSKALWLV